MNIPDIIRLITLDLDVISRVVCKFVCKNWYDIIKITVNDFDNDMLLCNTDQYSECFYNSELIKSRIGSIGDYDLFIKLVEFHGLKKVTMKHINFNICNLQNHIEISITDDSILGVCERGEFDILKNMELYFKWRGSILRSNFYGCIFSSTNTKAYEIIDLHLLQQSNIWNYININCVFIEWIRSKTDNMHISNIINRITDSDALDCLILCMNKNIITVDIDIVRKFIRSDANDCSKYLIDNFISNYDTAVFYRAAAKSYNYDIFKYLIDSPFKISNDTLVDIIYIKKKLTVSIIKQIILIVMERKINIHIRRIYDEHRRHYIKILFKSDYVFMADDMQFCEHIFKYNELVQLVRNNQLANDVYDTIELFNMIRLSTNTI
jgi:hypothetical protein